MANRIWVMLPLLLLLSACGRETVFDYEVAVFNKAEERIKHAVVKFQNVSHRVDRIKANNFSSDESDTIESPIEGYVTIEWTKYSGETLSEKLDVGGLKEFSSADGMMLFTIDSTDYVSVKYLNDKETEAIWKERLER